MLSKENVKEIWEKLSANKEAREFFAKHDVKGLIEKCKEIGYDLKESDITELLVRAKEIGKDELANVAAAKRGCGKPQPGFCAIDSCDTK